MHHFVVDSTTTQQYQLHCRTGVDSRHRKPEIKKEIAQQSYSSPLLNHSHFIPITITVVAMLFFRFGPSSWEVALKGSTTHK